MGRNNFFEWNENGICTDHNVHVVFQDKWTHSLKVFTAIHHGLWGYGYSICQIGNEIGNWGAGTGIHYNDCIYSTEKEAFLSALDYIKETYNQPRREAEETKLGKSYYPGRKVSDKIMKAIKDQDIFPNEKQLTLF